MLEFLKAPFLVLRFSCFTFNDIPDDVVCNIAICADDTTLYSNCDQASDLWQQLELASELESDPRDTMDWGKRWLVDFNAGKTQLVSFGRFNNNDFIDVKMDGSVLEEKSYFKMLQHNIRKVINVQQEKCRTKNGALRNSSINWIFL